MSAPNPPNASRRHYRRFSDERIWREFFCACIISSGERGNIEFDARVADRAYAEYRKRFPLAAAALEPDTEPEESTGQTKEGIQ